MRILAYVGLLVMFAGIFAGFLYSTVGEPREGWGPGLTFGGLALFLISAGVASCAQ